MIPIGPLCVKNKAGHLLQKKKIFGFDKRATRVFVCVCVGCPAGP